MSEIDKPNPDNSDAGDPIDPDALMGKVNRLSFLAMFIVSLIIHGSLIGATSIGYIQDCLKYKTWSPDVVLRQKAKEKRAAERAEKRAKRQAEEAKAVAEKKKKKPAKTKTPTSKPKTKIEQDINRQSTTLPKKSGVVLDGDDIDL